MDSDSDSERPVEVKQKSRKPPNTAFRQQRLKAWQPILTPKTVLPLFFCVTIIFAPLGGVMLWASNRVQEIVINYSHCEDQATDTLSEIPSNFYNYHFNDNAEPSNKPQWRLVSQDEGNTVTSSGIAIPVSKVCQLQFDIPTSMGPPVFMFYRLTSFYQNHRRYVQSFNEDQINGKAVTNSSLKSKDDCKPLTLNSDGIAYYPCGLIANSFFNDTFSSPVLLNPPSGQSEDYFKMTEEGIAWATDRNRFKKTNYNPADVVPPPNWAQMFPNGYTEENMPDISTWESLQNWMRTAGLPTFSKLARRNDDTVLEIGTYQIDIGTNFPVLKYNGSKSLVLTTRSVLGGRNPFLGIAYLVIAGVTFALGMIFLVKHLIKPRKLGDHSYLTWNNEQPATGAATGAARDADGLRNR